MDSELLQRRFDRERAARKQAEALLEQKSLELYRANEDLRKLADNLENQVQERTAELVRARDEALQANRHKSEFLSRMSHELRTPMNSILGFSQLLESDPVDPLTPGQLESLNEITRAGRHLLELINEVLDLARIESGRLNLSPEEVDLPELLDECLSLVAPMAEQRGIRLVNRFAEVSACRLQADPLRLRQILLNLLSNGVKYNREGGLLEVERPQLHNGKLSLAIRDTGLGIDPAGLQQVFEPFTRVGEEHTVEGTGIGLTISKRLIEMMDGEIGAESRPDHGWQGGSGTGGGGGTDGPLPGAVHGRQPRQPEARGPPAATARRYRNHPRARRGTGTGAGHGPSARPYSHGPRPARDRRSRDAAPDSTKPGFAGNPGHRPQRPCPAVGAETGAGSRFSRLPRHPDTDGQTSVAAGRVVGRLKRPPLPCFAEILDEVQEIQFECQVPSAKYRCRFATVLIEKKVATGAPLLSTQHSALST
jgi:signal transduction histidine kinase